MEDNEIKIPAEFADIAPISDKEFHNEMSILVEEPMFKHVIRMVLPDYKYNQLKHILLALNTKQEFQVKVMKPFVDGIIKKTASGLSNSGLDQLDPKTPYTFITNHRDIVLDSAQLSYTLVSAGRDTCEIAIGLPTTGLTNS